MTDNTNLPQGYEQRKLIVALAESDFASLELSELCKSVDCSWAEAYRLSDHGFISVEMDDVNKRIMVSITSYGMWASQEIRKTDITEKE